MRGKLQDIGPDTIFNSKVVIIGVELDFPESYQKQPMVCETRAWRVRTPRASAFATWTTPVVVHLSHVTRHVFERQELLDATPLTALQRACFVSTAATGSDGKRPAVGLYIALSFGTCDFYGILVLLSQAHATWRIRSFDKNACDDSDTLDRARPTYEGHRHPFRGPASLCYPRSEEVVL